MEQRAWVATRKGLFKLRQRAGAWAVERISFLGEPVSMVLPPTKGGRVFAALNLGHFGVKLHGSDDGGVTWNELTTPAYPKQPEGEPLAGVACSEPSMTLSSRVCASSGMSPISSRNSVPPSASTNLP